MDTVKDSYVRAAKLKRVIDGDTIVVDLDLGFGVWNRQIIRLAGVDTPEMRMAESSAGRWVKRKVEEWIGDSEWIQIHSHKFDFDKYQRVVAEVWVGGRSLNRWLLEHGYGWPTDDDGKQIGPRSIEALAIPDGVKQQVREAMA